MQITSILGTTSLRFLRIKDIAISLLFSGKGSICVLLPIFLQTCVMPVWEESFYMETEEDKNLKKAKQREAKRLVRVVLTSDDLINEYFRG